MGAPLKDAELLPPDIPTPVADRPSHGKPGQRRPDRLTVVTVPFVNVRYLVGAVLLAVVVLATTVGPLLVPYEPNAQNISARLEGPSLSSGHLLGTDALGRDLLARILAGGRISLLLAVAGTILSALVGVTAGLVAAYRRGRLETSVMGVVDASLAFPFILLAIALVATVGSSIATVLAVMTLSAWVGFARPIHAMTLSLVGRDFVTAAHGLGLGGGTIIRRHLLPHVLPVALVIGTLQIAQLILFESALSFLGMGVPASIPTWGSMLSESRNYIQIAPWTSVLPGLAIVASVFSLSLVGDWVRALVNPRG
jgi:peptide/nickel transport system permease protein